MARCDVVVIGAGLGGLTAGAIGRVLGFGDYALNAQLAALERYAGLGASDRIDHPRGHDAHDNVAN